MKLIIDMSSRKFWMLILFLGLLYYMVFHFSIFPIGKAEVLRLNSPDGMLDAVYVTSGAGAMVSGNYLIYIVPKGQETGERDSAIFWGKRTFDLEITWRSDRELLIQYSDSDIKHFQSYFYPFPKDARDKVEIRKCMR